MSAAAANLPTDRRGRMLWLVLALFLLPVAVAVLMVELGWRPVSSGNHGELMHAAPLSFASLRAADDSPLPAAALAGSWLLVLADAGPCSHACQLRLDESRRVHVALNKNMGRVKRVWLAPAPGSDPAQGALRQAYPDLIVARPGDEGWAGLLPPTGSRIYVIDPDGRPVLRFSEPIDARGLLKDLDRLLKLSWLG